MSCSVTFLGTLSTESDYLMILFMKTLKDSLRETADLIFCHLSVMRHYEFGA